MAEDKQSLEKRVEFLESEVRNLRLCMDQLAQGGLVGEASSVQTAEPETALSAQETSEEIISWASRASLLQRVSTLCFLLVVALMLRTATDNSLIDTQVGSLIGMTYAAVLIAVGGYLYSRSSPLSPVFTLCGGFLLFSVVVETHRHFEALPTVPAYVILVVVGGAMAWIGHRFSVASPVFVGSLGLSLAGFALDYPTPVFPYLAALLFIANLFGIYATRLQRCSWLRWILLAATLFMLQIWSFKINLFMVHSPGQDLPFDMSGFLPAIASFGILFIATALLGILERVQNRISKFDLALPTIAVVWTFVSGRYVVGAGVGSESALAWVGTVFAVILLVVAWLLGSRREPGAPGTNSFALAGAVLISLAFPLLVGKLLSLTVLSAVALGCAKFSTPWRGGGLRATSYLLQFYACGALARQLWETGETVPSVVSAAGAGALAVLALLHYGWSKKNPVPEESVVFSRFDKQDRLSSLLLFAAMIGGFFTLRVGIYQALDIFGLADYGTFTCAQSVLLNVSAVILMILAVAKKNREFRNLAILLTVFGGAKVGFVDLINAKGVPLVLSVFVFGLAAAIESFVLSRWEPGGSAGVAGGKQDQVG